MGSTAGHQYSRQACKYCGDQISVNSLVRHETQCQNRSPEQREQVMRAREHGRRRYERQPVAVKEEKGKQALEEARKREQHRQYSRQYYARRKANGGKPLLKLAAATRHATRMLNGKLDDREYVTFRIRVERVHLLSMLTQLFQVNPELVHISPDDLDSLA